MQVILLSNVDNGDNNVHIFVSFSTANKPTTLKLINFVQDMYKLYVKYSN